eukprot:scaffold1694_cov126-Isochrysis_galbana.AAC.2
MGEGVGRGRDPVKWGHLGVKEGARRIYGEGQSPQSPESNPSIPPHAPCGHNGYRRRGEGWVGIARCGGPTPGLPASAGRGAHTF